MKQKFSKVPYIMLTPFFVLFMCFFVYPLIYSLYISLFIKRAGNSIFVGFQNYEVVLKDELFWEGLQRVLYFGVVQITFMIIFAVFLALIIDSPFVKAKSFFRLVIFLPYAVPAVIAGIMWGFLYSPQLNTFSQYLRVFNNGDAFNVLSDQYILYGIMNIVTWSWIGYNMTIYIASLTSVSPELFDAAEIDGCTEFQKAWHIKLPLIRPTILMMTVLSIIGTIQLFNEPYVLARLANLIQSYTPNMYIYNMAFSYGNIPRAAAMSTVLTLITFVLTMIVLYVTRRQEKVE